MDLQHVLVINPNTSESVTQRLVTQLSADWSGVQIHGVTADFGAPYIADEYSYCIAGHAVLDAWEHAQEQAPAQGYACVLVACFGDPGLDALREVAGIPVWGLAQASMCAMQLQGYRRVAIVTGGEKWKPMLERWGLAQGFMDTQAQLQIVQISVLSANGMQLLKKPESTLLALTDSSAQALTDSNAHVVLLGGAGLAGMGKRVRQRSDLPVWDCVEAAQQWLAFSLRAVSGPPDVKSPEHIQ